MALLLICVNHLLIRHPFEACKYSICSLYEIPHSSLKNKQLISIFHIETFPNLVIPEGNAD